MVEKEAIKYEPIREYIEKKITKKRQKPFNFLLIFYSYAVSMSLSLVGREG